jgi:hypothetical protein
MYIFLFHVALLEHTAAFGYEFANSIKHIKEYQSDWKYPMNRQ